MSLRLWRPSALLPLLTANACAAVPPARISVEPESALIDVPVSMRMTGLRSGETISLRARAVDALDRTWESRTILTADRDGVIDLSPADIDRNGLFWSMNLTRDARVASPFRPSLSPLVVSLFAERGSRVIATALVERLFIGPRVIRTAVRADGVVGTFFRPEGSAPHPGVVVVGGSGGGVSENDAALLASRGFATLALAYFRYDGVPDDLINIPIEYFENGVRWMARQESVRSDRLGMIGTSRGAEAALFAASIIPDLKAVVAIVPSVVLWGGVSSDPWSVTQPAWSRGGVPLPFIARELHPAETGQVSRTEPLRLAPTFHPKLQDLSAVERARIPIETMRARLLLISAGDDGLWPSQRMAEMIAGRLEVQGLGDRVRHVTYAGAGHVIPLPNLPTTVHSLPHRVRGYRVEAGGDARATASAARESWGEVLGFLNATLRQR